MVARRESSPCGASFSLLRRCSWRRGNLRSSTICVGGDARRQAFPLGITLHNAGREGTDGLIFSFEGPNEIVNLTIVRLYGSPDFFNLLL